MALMLSSLYDALLDAGTSEEKARKAAEEAAQYEARFARLEADVIPEGLRSSIWMVGVNLAIGLGILVKLFTT